MADSSDDRLLRDREGAAIFGVCRAQFWALVKKGTLPAPVRIGRATRWSERELQATLCEFLAGRSVDPGSCALAGSRSREEGSVGENFPDTMPPKSAGGGKGLR